MKLSIVIVNYNVQYFLEQALLSVRKATQMLESEVFVVDNNSVDDSVSMVKKKFPEVKLIVNRDNVGFSKANNQAIDQATGQYILLLNPDTIVKEDTFERCVQVMDERPDVGGLGVKMLDGSGSFLPESKRGFPSPFVAFCKVFGLSSIFPRSRLFNRYHLGYLDAAESHEVDVLAGAYMMLRRSVLQEIGTLDEAFFMYGEDIDLSYRIVQAGYKNYYYAGTAIIHYKGESTKKGSLNYVRVFYNAMIIFARKHFAGKGAGAFVLFLNLAIYFRAFLTLARQFFRRAFLPISDAAIMWTGLLGIKQFWAVYHFKDPLYYPDYFNYFNAPLYASLWVLGIYLSGNYDDNSNLRRLIRGIFFGTLMIASVYGFLDMAYRSSRAIIIFATFWALLSLPILRIVVHFLKHRNFKISRQHERKLAIIGSEEESYRVKGLLQEAGVRKDIVGLVSPGEDGHPETYLGGLHQLDEVVHIYKIEELIFCSKNVSAQDIMHWMVQLGPRIDYKIVPEESFSIIGSSSKETAGELYTIDIKFRVDAPLERRNKRLLDLVMGAGILLFFPLLFFLFEKPARAFRNTVAVVLGTKTLVGYVPVEKKQVGLPRLKAGILSPLDELEVGQVSQQTRERLNFIYAKDYAPSRDVDIFWRGWRNLDRITGST